MCVRAMCSGFTHDYAGCYVKRFTGTRRPYVKRKVCNYAQRIATHPRRPRPLAVLAVRVVVLSSFFPSCARHIVHGIWTATVTYAAWDSFCLSYCCQNKIDLLVSWFVCWFILFVCCWYLFVCLFSLFVCLFVCLLTQVLFARYILCSC